MEEDVEPLHALVVGLEVEEQLVAASAIGPAGLPQQELGPRGLETALVRWLHVVVVEQREDRPLPLGHGRRRVSLGEQNKGP